MKTPIRPITRFVRRHARAGRATGPWIATVGRELAISAPFPRIGLLALLLALVALLLPASALAAVQPDVSTDSAQSVTAAQEIVSGTVNPHGLSTVYHLEYAAAGSSWCADETQGTPTTTTNATLHYTDSVSHIVSVAPTGLSGGTSYCAELVATNGGGTSRGGQLTFTAGLPSVTTTAADATGVQQAAVQGSVDPASQSTTYFADYDLATSQWCTSGGAAGSPAHRSPPATLAYQDALDHNVTVNVTGLQAATGYCAAIAASNASSTTAGVGVVGMPSTFTTETPVTTGSIQSTSATAALLSGSVNPDGVSTSYYAIYAPVSSDWCQTGGTSGHGYAPDGRGDTALPGPEPAQRHRQPHRLDEGHHLLRRLGVPEYAARPRPIERRSGHLHRRPADRHNERRGTGRAWHRRA